MDYVFAALAGVVVVILFFSMKRSKLSHIPTLGYSTPLLSYITAYKFRSQSREMIKEGYRKYPNQVWKLSTLDGWFIVANGPSRVEEMNKASGRQLSAILNFQSYLQLDYTLGPEVTTNPYHINVVRSTMTRNVAAQFVEMRAEAINAFEELIPEGHSIPIFSSIAEVISRINARLAVGPKQDLPRFMWAFEHRADERKTPSFCPDLPSPLIVNSSADIGAMAKHLEPLVAHRLSEQRLHGFDWPEKPNDTLMWIMDEAQGSGEEVTAYGMATRIYFLTFASDGIAMMLSCALHEVATRPEYIKPLREEVESVTSQDGWNKDSIGKLHKMDSFFREVHRCYDLNILHLGRRAVKDFVFSDGTIIPAGSDIFSNAYGIHYDENLYPSAHTFDGFRFVQEDGAKQARLQFTKPGLDYIPFGYGKHACPGRFTAAYQMKTMLAYLITTYDIETDKVQHPMRGFLEKAFSANLDAEVTFRRRQICDEISSYQSP